MGCWESDRDAASPSTDFKFYLKGTRIEHTAAGRRDSSFCRRGQCRGTRNGSPAQTELAELGIGGSGAPLARKTLTE